MTLIYVLLNNKVLASTNRSLNAKTNLIAKGIENCKPIVSV